jgi:hypothetical protein
MPIIAPLFSIPVFIDEFPVSSADRECCSNLVMWYEDLSNIYLSTDYHILNLPQLSHLKLRAQSAMDVYTRDILHIHERARLEITTSWYITITDRSTVSDHFHSHSLFTGVIVLDALPGSRLVLSMESPPVVPKIINFDYTEFNTFNSRSWWLDLEPNHIYIFPSTVNHTVEHIEKDTSMNLLVFDTFVNGNVGEDMNAIHITAT